MGAGIPDLLICDEFGVFHFVELKFLTSNGVTLQPSREGEWVPDDDSIDATVLVIEEVFRRIDVYSKKGMAA